MWKTAGNTNNDVIKETMFKDKTRFDSTNRVKNEMKINDQKKFD